MDDKSTPITSLNNTDDSEVVNNILSKYDSLENNQNNPNEMTEMEKIKNELRQNKSRA